MTAPEGPDKGQNIERDNLHMTRKGYNILNEILFFVV
jgi:hypothetical protein